MGDFKEHIPTMSEERRIQIAKDALVRLGAGDYAELRDAIGRVREIHRPIRVYDECECDLEDGDNHKQIEVCDYMACEKSFIGWACEFCCYCDEFPLDHCPHEATHNGVLEEDSCPTNQALKGIKRHDQLDFGGDTND